MDNSLKHYKTLITKTSQINTPQINTPQSLFEEVKKSQSFLNPEKSVTNEESFKYIYTLCKFKEIGNNCTRKNNIKEHFKNINFDNINYPLKKEDYERFETNNNVSLRVYEPNYNNNKIYTH